LRRSAQFVFAESKEPAVSLPRVRAAAVPFYPPAAHTANISGIVRVAVTTDGHRVTEVKVLDDGRNPALGRAAQENASTWVFAVHDATTFTVTYRYILEKDLPDIKSNAPNSKVVLRFPTDVEVHAVCWPGTVDRPAIVH
jgi:hypothetical protein